MRAVPFILALVACGGGADATDRTDDGNPDDASTDTVDADADGSGLEDPCPAAAPACPTAPSGFGAGDPLAAIDRCAFPLTDGGTWTDQAALVDALPAEVPRVTLADVALDLNRTGTEVAAAEIPGRPPGVRSAFGWESGDQGVEYWIPQGITGSFDGMASGTVGSRKLVLVSWYYEQANDPGSTVEKGVRIAIADVTNPAAVGYRFALLVEPVASGGRTDFAPVRIHAGGLAWVGDYLYVPVTGSGFRVFDLAHILKVDTSKDALGYDAATGAYHAHSYAYAIPQVGVYTDAGACDSVFSFVALDRSTSSLLSGEYSSEVPTGRLMRWPIDLATGRLVETERGRVVPDGVWFIGHTHVQGALSRGETFWLSSSRPVAGAGELVRTGASGAPATFPWVDAPEDLAFDPATNELWCASEHVDKRFVFSVAATAID